MHVPNTHVWVGGVLLGGIPRHAFASLMLVCQVYCLGASDICVVGLGTRVDTSSYECVLKKSMLHGCIAP